MPRLTHLILAAAVLTSLACGYERDDGVPGRPLSPPGDDDAFDDDDGGETDTGEDSGEADDDGGGGHGGTGGDEGNGDDGDGGDDGSDGDGDDTGGNGDDGGTGDGETYTGPYAAERKLCTDLNNMFRAQMGVPVLTRAADKEACVDEQARLESEIDTPHGKLGHCGELRQNHGDGIGYGTLELIDWLINDQFNEGPGGPHYEQMLDPNMTRIACGFYANPSNGNFWINIDFW